MKESRQEEGINFHHFLVDSNMATLTDAAESAKSFIAKMKGLDTNLSGKRLIDYLDFTIVKTEDTEEAYILIEDFIAGLFLTNRVRFKIAVNKETGNVEKIEKIDQE